MGCPTDQDISTSPPADASGACIEVPLGAVLLDLEACRMRHVVRTESFEGSTGQFHREQSSELGRFEESGGARLTPDGAFMKASSSASRSPPDLG